jgi:hypothetical protein
MRIPFKIVVLLLVLTGFLQAADRVPAPNFGKLPENWQTVIRGYWSMPGRLKDPYSAVYRFETPRRGFVKDGIFVGGKTHYGWIVSTWINAKNSFGGYTGAQLFYVMFFGENGNVGDVTEMFEMGRGKFVP